MNYKQHQQQSKSHFEELKSQQKQEQTKFTHRLLHDLDQEKSKVEKNKSYVDKKIVNADSVQNQPVSTYTHDPIGSHSPIPRKRSVKVYDICCIRTFFRHLSIQTYFFIKSKKYFDLIC